MQTQTEPNINVLNAVKAQSQLIEFGLNPFDWMLTPLSSSKFLIHNLDDSDFCFMGEYNKGSWANLEVYSL